MSPLDTHVVDCGRCRAASRDKIIGINIWRGRGAGRGGIIWLEGKCKYDDGARYRKFVSKLEGA